MNEKQKQVVNYDGDLIVMAGAGSGKTYVLQKRVEKLLETKKAETILAITFTNKAADELTERIDNADVNTYTFHGWSVSRLKKILKKTKGEYYDESFDVLSEDEQEYIIKVLIKKNKELESFSMNHILQLFSEAKNKCLLPFNESYPSDVFNFLGEDIGKLYMEYNKFLMKNNVMDYDDLLAYYYHFLTLGFENKEMSDVLIDEAQDLNEIQKNIVLEFKKKGSRLFLVGDYDQSIYSWRGSNPEVMFDFQKEFSLKVIVLEETYRFHSEILKNAEEIISKNPARFERETKTNLNVNGVFEKNEYENEYKEIENIIRKIKTTDTKKENIAILLRNKKEGLLLKKMFEQNGIRFVDGDDKVNPFKTREGKIVHALLKIKRGNYKNIDILKLIFELGIVGETSMENINNAGFDMDDPQKLWDSFNKYSENKIPDLDGNSEVLLSTVKFIIETTLKEDIKSYIFKVFNAFKIETLGSNKVLEAFIQSINECDDFINNFTIEKEKHNEFGLKREGFVNIMTIHGAKGLEFDDVFVPAVERGIFPIKEDACNKEEERRLLYVAATRAKKNTYISWCLTRYLYGEKTTTGKSFLL